MLSAPQQRGRLRSIIVRRLKEYNIGYQLRSNLSAYGQTATGSLGRRISYEARNLNVSVSSDIDGSTGYIDNVVVTIDLPWENNYARKLDTEAGASENAENQMMPSIDALVQWINAKNIKTTMTVTSSLKSGGRKEYTYTDTLSSKRRMAWFVQQNIIEENELRTRNDYAEELRIELEDLLNEATEEWFDEISVDFMGEVYVEIGNILA